MGHGPSHPPNPVPGSRGRAVRTQRSPGVAVAVTGCPSVATWRAPPGARTSTDPGPATAIFSEVTGPSFGCAPRSPASATTRKTTRRRARSRKPRKFRLSWRSSFPLGQLEDLFFRQVLDGQPVDVDDVLDNPGGVVAALVDGGEPLLVSPPDHRDRHTGNGGDRGAGDAYPGGQLRHGIRLPAEPTRLPFVKPQPRHGAQKVEQFPREARWIGAPRLGHAACANRFGCLPR